MARDGRSERTEVQRITTAQEALSAEQSRRTRRYLISMAIRTVCFIGAIIASGWLRWTLVAGAVVLPYVAVIMANAGRKRSEAAPPTMIVNDQRQIGSPPQG